MTTLSNEQEKQSTVVDKEETSLFAAIRDLIAMISVYLETFGGSEDGILPALPYHLQNTQRYLISALSHMSKTNSCDSNQTVDCPMFHTLEDRISEIKKLKDNPQALGDSPDILDGMSKSDLSNAIQSFT